MEKYYRICSVFVKDEQNMPYRQSPGHYFWQLVEESQASIALSRKPIVKETLYAFPTTWEIDKSASTQSTSFKINTSIKGFPTKWKVYCFDHNENHTYHFLPKVSDNYLDKIPFKENDARKHWEEAKKSLSKKIEIVTVNPKSMALNHFIRNMVYEKLAKEMQIELHSLLNVSSLQPSTLLLDTTKGTFAIEAAVVHTSVDIGSFKLYSFPLRVGHHFLRLVQTCDQKKTTVDVIHGLSVRYKIDRYGNISSRTPRCIGTFGSRLKACNPNEIVRDTKGFEWETPHQVETIYMGKNTTQKWNHLKSILSTLNDAEMRYSSLGFGKSLGFLNTKNSNSTYATLSYILGGKPHQFQGYVAPGKKTTMLSKEKIEALSQENRGLEVTKETKYGTLKVSSFTP